MSQTYAPVQPYNLFKSCMIIFFVQAVLVILLAPIVNLDLMLRVVILFFNLLISVFLGWRLYRSRYHMIFAFDQKGFNLKKGSKDEVSRQWKEFSGVSLVRTPEGSFSVRLYVDSEFFDLPVSKLRLNPFDFRFEIMKLVSENK